MHEHEPPSPTSQPAKRQRQSSAATAATSPTNPGPSPSHNDHGTASNGAARASQSSSNFRNVSACNRCRLRKNRCDQRLPSCASCAKAGVACVGYDPITKKEIPRSYVFYLETRVEQLESLLNTHNIRFPAAENLEPCSRPGAQPAAKPPSVAEGSLGDREEPDPAKPQTQAVEALKPKKGGEDPTMLNIVSPSKPKSLASASGVSFARVVFAAVQYSVSDHLGAGDRPGSRHPSGSGTSMRDSFFGLHTKPTIKPAAFPSRDVATRLVTLYFEHANPQIPILHRGEFMQMFEQAYSSGEPRNARELYMLNMVFAIGSGVIVGEPVKTEASNDTKMSLDFPSNQAQPEEYHASAIVHLESCLSNSGGGLEVLQAVLLLANFALLRPVPPGLWYIIGVAVRLAVDLGLHYEDGSDADGLASEPDQEYQDAKRESDSQVRGRRQWIRDMRRRLWWCTYSFDRLVGTCVGRPFGISDQVITTELPCLLDDAYITPATGIMGGPSGEEQPSYKHVAHHYFRLRMLQSEILQVLQYNQAQLARAAAPGAPYPEMHNHLPCPFLVHFDSFRSWRLDIDNRLLQWKHSAPTREETGVAFSTEFLELNYWQAIIMLYRQSLSVPEVFEGEYNTSNEVNSPTAFTAELREDEEQIYLKVAEAGQKILRIYRQLHLSGLVSYTYLSTHHLFMAGISYLYAIWHSPAVRSRLSMDDVDFTVLAAKSVFSDLIDKCPPAETCRDAFDRTAKATIKMASSSGGFGTPVQAMHRKPRRATTSSGGVSRDGVSAAVKRRQQSFGQRGSHLDPQAPQAPQAAMSLSGALSSPGLSGSGDVTVQQTSPLSHTRNLEGDGFNPQSTRDADLRLEDDSLNTGAAAVAPRTSPQVAANNMHSQPPDGSSFAAQQQQPFDMHGAMDYSPDAPTREFLQNLGVAPDGDQAQLDLGFGFNWEGLGNDYGEGQQMNPFDSFFFGPQQGGGGGGAGSGMDGM